MVVVVVVVIVVVDVVVVVVVVVVVDIGFQRERSHSGDENDEQNLELHDVRAVKIDPPENMEFPVLQIKI